MIKEDLKNILKCIYYKTSHSYSIIKIRNKFELIVTNINNIIFQYIYNKFRIFLMINALFFIVFYIIIVLICFHSRILQVLPESIHKLERYQQCVTKRTWNQNSRLHYCFSYCDKKKKFGQYKLLQNYTNLKCQ